MLVTDYLTVGKPHFFFHLLEQLSAVHSYTVGQITSIKLETVMFPLPFSTFFPPVKLLCVELRFICISTCLHYNCRISVFIKMCCYLFFIFFKSAPCGLGKRQKGSINGVFTPALFHQTLVCLLRKPILSGRCEGPRYL